ncbi:hypothetical protein ABG067_007183 [Albugo candida]
MFREEYASELAERTREMKSQSLAERQLSQNVICKNKVKKEKLALELREMHLCDTIESDQLREKELHKAKAWAQFEAARKMYLQRRYPKDESTAKEKKEQAETVSMLPIGIEDEKESLAKEFEDKEQLLGASIEAKEAAAWSLMREKHRRELQALTGASVAIRIDTAKDAASTAAFEAHKTAQIVDEVKVESIHYAVMMTQRKRLEAPISVRKLRKLKALDMFTHTMEANDQLLSLQAAKEAIDAIEWKRIHYDTVDEEIRTESFGRAGVVHLHTRALAR